MHQNRKILKSAGLVGILTLVSRLFGYLRDVSLAVVLGAGYSMDAFTIAFRLANLFRRLVGEGAMTASFVPVFAEYREKHSKDELWRFVNQFFYTLAAVLICLMIIQIVFAPTIVGGMSPGFMKSAGKWELTVFLNRLMAPYIFFVALTALMAAILNSMGKFAVSAANPILFNIAMIAAAFGLSPWFDDPAVGVAIGVVFGGFLQLIVHIPAAWMNGMRFIPSFSFKHPAIQKVMLLMGPGVFGIGIVQINLFVDSIMASFLPEGSVSAIYYANRVEELVLGIFTVSLATVILPEMSAQAAKNDQKAMKSTLLFSLRMTSFVTIPATVGLVILSGPITQVLFQHGKFSALDTERTAFALLFYAVGLFFIAGVRIVVPAFYAVQDTKTPVKCAFISLVVNIIGNWILMHPMKQGGLALATSIAAAINFFQLLNRYQRKFGPLDWGLFRESMLRISVQSIGMALVAMIFIRLLAFHDQSSAFMRALVLFLTIALSLLTYFGLALLLKSKELEAFRHAHSPDPEAAQADLD